MKTRLLLSLFLMGLVLTVNSNVEGPRAVDLQGELDKRGSRSVVLPEVTAEQSDYDVILNFSKPVGTVNITVSSGSEVAYSTTLNVTDVAQFSIYTGGFEAGTYLLEITKPSTNGRVYGEFDIE